jgi:hypothetical protein
VVRQALLHPEEEAEAQPLPPTTQSNHPKDQEGSSLLLLPSAVSEGAKAEVRTHLRLQNFGDFPQMSELFI